jgi:choline dehydrogenase-like flavoprotein
MLESEFSRMSLGRIEWDAWVNQDSETIKTHLIDAYHHMGTTRMSPSDASGVVDENCRMHGVQNLYIAGSSVFPTSGHSNPTLTFMALALRLGQHLKSQFNS